MPTYRVRKAAGQPPVGKWNDPVWQVADTLHVNHFYDKSSDHRPPVQARLLYTDRGLHVLYDVKDRYVMAVRQGYQASVCKDSCVEFFLKPKPDKGYFNFEINCGGQMLLYYIEDATPAPTGGFAKYTKLPDADLDLIKINHSLPTVVTPERTEPTDWWLQAFIPWELFERYMGKVRPLSGQTWRGNFYKCADDTSHPHWASWSVVEGSLNFHKPEYFGEVKFE
jgi:hypothetical protein